MRDDADQPDDGEVARDPAASTSDPAPDGAAQDGAVGALDLSDEESELVAADLDVLLPTLDGARRERFAQLRAAAAEQHVPAELEPALVSLLELTLQTARARARYKAEGERTLTQLYGRTSAGRELSGHLGQVNDALKALAGHTVEGVTVRMRTVGHFTITVQTDGATITLATRPDSVDVEAIAVGS